MRNKTNTTKPRATKTVRLETSRMGNPLPAVEIHLPGLENQRLLWAELHELAAKVERATPDFEGWCVNIDRTGDESGAVSLELLDCTPEEVSRAMDLLKRVAG